MPEVVRREKEAGRRLLVWIAAAVGSIGHEAGNNQPLNLLRAFVNLENFGVAHQLFHGVPGKMLQKSLREALAAAYSLLKPLPPKI